MLGMDRSKQMFDFSLDAQEFRQRLAEQLHISCTDVQELADDDLEWVNAAGVPQHVPDDDPLKRQ